MKKQLLQKPACSLLVAALVSMIPLAAAQAEDNEQTYRQESEARGAQGPVRSDAVRSYQRYEGDSNPFMDPSGIRTYRYDERGAQGPVRSDMSASRTYQRYEGDSNPFMDPGGVHTYRYDERGAQGPMRSGTGSPGSEEVNIP